MTHSETGCNTNAVITDETHLDLAMRMFERNWTPSGAVSPEELAALCLKDARAFFDASVGGEVLGPVDHRTRVRTGTSTSAYPLTALERFATGGSLELEVEE